MAEHHDAVVFRRRLAQPAADIQNRDDQAPQVDDAPYVGGHDGQAGDGVIVDDGKIASLQRNRDTVKEVKKGFECGITLENFSDIKENDIIENYEMVEVKK